ncbi:hypothetical protein [Hyphomicrobium sp. D-2]|uniref:tetratricopeptide repeat protein n=1 Tax=Hyphomicrobium sp. D-2 TaxID=3041621 RepID=UPI0024571A30|nr:hypothetical protein [Hyphomicrobium sp. D-2]MDH4982590.1 hypothetical protein [Hyphomicrobium sp. D-2]
MTDSEIQGRLEVAARLRLEGDVQAAVAEYENLVRRGCAFATVQLGFMLQQGDVVAKDEARAEELLCRAAESGDWLGKYFYANFLESVQRSEEAFGLMNSTAAVGHLPAINRLGLYYLKGTGCEADELAGIHYRTYAADYGHLFAKKWRAARRMKGFEGLGRVLPGVVEFLSSTVMIFWLTVRAPNDPRVVA